MSAPTNEKPVIEFRGCDMLVYAEVLTDGMSGITFGEAKNLAPIGNYGKSSSASSTTKFYDNAPALSISAEDADTITLLTPVLPLERLADITGKDFDAATGALLDGDKHEKYFALGVRCKLTDGTYRYIWRLKGTFAVPDENAKTEDNTTDTNNMTLTYTGIKTIYEFAKEGRSKGVVVDERDGRCSPSKLASDWFSQVVTSDTLSSFAIVTSVDVTDHVTVEVGATANIYATVVPSYTEAQKIWASANTSVATVEPMTNMSGCYVTGVRVGVTEVTITVGALTASCTVAVVPVEEQGTSGTE